MTIVRSMGRNDVAGIFAIEQQSVSAWSRAQIAAELDSAGPVLVAEDEIGLVGWCCGRSLGGEAELLKIAVTGERRRQGLGTMLYLAFERMLVAEGCTTLFLEVREANYPAIGFYRRQGFKEVGCRSKYYADPEEDALVLRKEFALSGRDFSRSCQEAKK